MIKVKNPATLDLLRDDGVSADNLDLGGPLALPKEFNCAEHAAKWVQKGNAVLAAQRRQPLQGTRFSADGWTPWVFPETFTVDGKKEKHEKAGMQYEVHLGTGGYILMFRPRAIQNQVDQAYGLLSRERMELERKGHTIDAKPPEKGMLTDQQLTKVLGQEANAETGEPVETVIHSTLPSSGNLSGKPIKVGR